MATTEICTSTKNIFNASTAREATEIINTVNDLSDYWPLTVRQIYYQLVAKEVIPNNIGQYKKVSRLLVKLRENDMVPWGAIEDRSRRTTDKRGFSDLGGYVRQQLQYLDPRYYGRCYVQEQNVYVEVSTEKDALSSILENELWMFCTRLNIVRGHVSATMIEQMAQRFDRAIMLGQEPYLLHFGDLDPSGIAIPKAIQRNLERRHDVEVEVHHIALTPSQVALHRLPCSIDSVKKSDPNYGAWVKTYGSDQPAVELDALRPDALQEILRDALMAVYDMEGIDTEKEIEREERTMLRKIKTDFIKLLARKYPALEM
jgi:hypothetical protein